MDQERIKFFLLNPLSPKNERSRVRFERPAWTRETFLKTYQNHMLREVPNDVVEAEFDRLVETGQIVVSEAGELSLGKVIFEHTKWASETAEKVVKYLHNVVFYHMQGFKGCSEDVQAEIKNTIAVIVDEKREEHGHMRIFPALHFVCGDMPVSKLGIDLADTIIANISDRRGLHLPPNEEGSYQGFYQVVELALEEAGIPKKEYQPTANDVADLLKLCYLTNKAKSAVRGIVQFAEQVGDTAVLEQIEQIEEQLAGLDLRYMQTMPRVHVEGVEEAKIKRGLCSHDLGGFCETFRVRVENIKTEDGGQAKILDLISDDDDYTDEDTQELFFRLQSWDDEGKHENLKRLNLDEGDNFILQIARISKE